MEQGNLSAGLPSLTTPLPLLWPPLPLCSTEQQYEVVRKVKDGKEVEVKEVLYGGTRDGKPVGGARYYMGEHFYGRCVQAPRAHQYAYLCGAGLCCAHGSSAGLGPKSDVRAVLGTHRALPLGQGRTAPTSTGGEGTGEEGTSSL